MDRETEKVGTSEHSSPAGNDGGSQTVGDFARRAFEPGVYDADGTFVFAKHPSADDLEQMYGMLTKEIGPDVASLDTVRRVFAHNPDTFWGIYRTPDEHRDAPKLVAFISYLPLNAAGFAALRDKTLTGRNPDLSLVAKPGETPSALYLWAMVTPGLGNLALMLTAHAMGLEVCERLPVFGWISTEAALNAIKHSTKSQEIVDPQIGSAFELKYPEKYRVQRRSLKIIEGPKSRAPARSRPKLETTLVSTPDQFAKIMAIRAAVFMIEQICPYEEEFDGNDYAGAHILGTVNGEPAAVLRIRYFAGFVKLERLAVLPRFRRTLIAISVVERALEICRRKGYRKMYGQSQLRLVSFWQRFGFRPMQKNKTLIFSDHEYVEIVGDIAPHADPLTPDSDPHVLIRPEGQWEKPGVLDRSAARPPTNPH
jgi:predicted GNAT family N-acyltransferase